MKTSSATIRPRAPRCAGALVLAALLAAGLAGCSAAAWSPDGKRIAFTYIDESVAGKWTGVGLYELGEKKAVRFHQVEERDAKNVERHFLDCSWAADGKSVLALEISGPHGGGENTNSLRIRRLQPDGGKEEVLATVEKAGMKFSPVLVRRDRWLWAGPFGDHENDKDSFFCLRLDLETGKSERFFSAEQPTLCFDFGKRGLFYLGSPCKGDKMTETVEVGKLDSETSKKEPLAKVDAVPLYLAGDPNGTGLVVLQITDDRGALALHLFDEKGKVVKDIPLPKDVSQAGSMVWEGGNIWVAVFQDDKLGLLCVEAATGKTRFVPLADPGDKDMLSWIRPAVSPDGKKLAVNTGLLRRDGDAPLIALTIVDLTAPDKAPEKIELSGKK